MVTVLLVLPLWLASAAGERAVETAPELGRVAWQRDLDLVLSREGLARSKKPTVVLFQEVPG